jgi:hypothetical protein
MFVSRIVGPTSEEDFAARCAQIVLPDLSDFQITAAPWTGSDGNFYLHGFHDTEDPSATVAEVVHRAGWDAETLVLFALRNPFSILGGKTTDCAMPHNKHAIGRNDSYKKCRNGHLIADIHTHTPNQNRLVNCPVCSDPLK